MILTIRHTRTHAHTQTATTTHRFRIDNTDHIFDVNKKQHDHDQVDLVCPQAQQQVATAGQDSSDSNNKSGPVNNNEPTTQQERYIIYSVSIGHPGWRDAWALDGWH